MRFIAPSAVGSGANKADNEDEGTLVHAAAHGNQLAANKLQQKPVRRVQEPARVVHALASVPTGVQRAKHVSSLCERISHTDAAATEASRALVDVLADSPPENESKQQQVTQAWIQAANTLLSSTGARDHVVEPIEKLPDGLEKRQLLDKVRSIRDQHAPGTRRNNRSLQLRMARSSSKSTKSSGRKERGSRWNVLGMRSNAGVGKKKASRK